MFYFTWNIFCSVCLLLQNIVCGAVGAWVGTDYKALPTGSWPTASSTHFSLPTPTAIIAGPLHPSTKMASIHSDAVWLYERVQWYNHGNNQELEEEKGKRAIVISFKTDMYEWRIFIFRKIKKQTVDKMNGWMDGQIHIQNKKKEGWKNAQKDGWYKMTHRW